MLCRRSVMAVVSVLKIVAVINSLKMYYVQYDVSDFYCSL